MTQNPFTFGNPIRDSSRFIGRQQIIQQIVSRLVSSAHESTSVVGERRIGKTSLLKHLADPDVAARYGIAKDEYCLVYIDFQGLTDITPLRFWQRVLRLMGRSMCDESLIPEIEDLRKKDEIDLFDLEDLFDLISDTGIHVVLLMDEFEFVTQNPNFGSDFFGGLRALAIHYNLSLVSGTRRELVDLCHSDEIKGSPFFNIFATVVLRSFDFGEARQLLTDYSTETGFDFTPQEINFVLNLVGSYPFFTQIGGYYMFDGKKNGLTGTRLLEYTLESFSDQSDQHFTYYWSHSSESEKITLLTILALTNKNKSKNKRATEKDIKELYSRASLDLNQLIKRGMVVQVGEEFRIFSPVFEQWISLEVSAIPGEEENPDSVAEWMKEGGNDHLNPVKGILPKFKKKYWGPIGTIVKEISIEFIEKVTVDMILGRFA